MMKYIVSWILVSYVPCKTAYTDEYGRYFSGYSTTLELCLKVKSDTLTKVFYNRDSAMLFIKNGNKDSTMFPLDFKIDSIIVK